jgi:glycosyltransferase involved in cell wall biosynthesis
MKEKPTVTVIIPVFNSEKTLNRAIDSMFDQTFKPTRLILVDDCSTDGTHSQILSIASVKNEIPITVIRNTKNLGPGISRNLGWELAETTWIAFLDADDAWHPRKLEIQFKAIDTNPNLDLICTQTILRGPDTMLPVIEEFSEVQLISFRRMFFKNEIPTRSVVIRRNTPFRFPKGLSEDFALWLQCLHGKLVVGKIDLPLSFHFRQEFSRGGLSSQLVAHELCELRNILKYFFKKPIVVSVAIPYSFLKFLRRVVIKVLRSISIENLRISTK